MQTVSVPSKRPISLYLFSAIAGFAASLVGIDRPSVQRRHRPPTPEYVPRYRLRGRSSMDVAYLVGAHVVPVVQNKEPSRQYRRYCERKGVSPR